MFGPVRAVAIDDEPAHLLSITAGLAAMGIPCMGYWWDKSDNELRPTPPEGGHPYVRLVFSDLNLVELGGIPEAPAIWATLVAVLQQVLSKKSGPYILVLWTQVNTKVEEVRQLIYSRVLQLGIPCPLAVVGLEKGPFIINPAGDSTLFSDQLQEFYTQLHSNMERLESEIRKVISVDPQINVVSAWESRAADAAARAVNEVHHCAVQDVTDPMQISGSLGKVLAKIATAAAGDASAIEAPARALDGGMLDILVDQLGASVESVSYEAVVSDSIGETVKAPITFGDEVGMFAELNTFFHVDREVAKVKASDRGAVIGAKRPDFHANILGFNPIDLITKEFLFPVELIDTDNPDKVREDIRSMTHAADFVLIEMGADCDHAQDHDRTHRYLVGLQVPEQLIYLAKRTDGSLRNAALELLGPWRIQSTTIYVLVSCRRFWTWQKKSPPPGATKYRLRASLVNKLLHRYSSWSSRPGIVEFR